MNNHVKGLSLLVFTSALYGLYGIYSRIIALEFGVFSQNWVRNVLVLLLALFFIFLFKHKWRKIAKKDAPWISAWIVCDILFVITSFISFNNLTIGTALFLLYSGSTITGYAAGTILLKEELTKTKIISVLISLLGLFFIFAEQIHLISIFYLFLGLFTGIVGGLWNVLPKLISHKYPKLELIALDAAGILLINLLLAGFYHQAVPPVSVSLAWLGIILYGISQLLGDLLLIQGFRLVEAHIGSLILTLEAVFGVLFAFLFFKEILPLTTLFGGFLIIVAAFLPNLPKLLKNS